MAAPVSASVSEQILPEIKDDPYGALWQQLFVLLDTARCKSIRLCIAKKEKAYLCITQVERNQRVCDKCHTWIETLSLQGTLEIRKAHYRDSETTPRTDMTAYVTDYHFYECDKDAAGLKVPTAFADFSPLFKIDYQGGHKMYHMYPPLGSLQKQVQLYRNRPPRVD